MKKILLTLLLFVFVNNISYAQNLYSGNAQYEVIYQYSMDRSVLKNNQGEPSQRIKDLSKESDQLISEMSGRLIFNNRASIYYSPESLPPPDMAHGIANAMVRADHNFFYNLGENLFIIENLTFGRKNRAIDDKEIIWNILPEKAIINGIECQKAEGIFKTPGFNDTVVEVWFATDIPFPYGPMDAYGLPGLILKYKWGVLEIEAIQITRITDGSVELIIPDFGDIPLFSGSLRGN